MELMVEVSPTVPVRAMELTTILDRCHRFRGFVYQQAHFSADKKSIEVAVRPRKGSVAICSRCDLPAPGYDQLPYLADLGVDPRYGRPKAIGAFLTFLHEKMYPGLKFLKLPPNELQNRAEASISL